MDVHKVASGFGYLMASQIASRLITFSPNLLVARNLSPEAYGLSSIQFHLLITIIMMLSREGFRRGCMRFKAKEGAESVDAGRVLRVAWLVVPLGVLVTCIACTIADLLHARSPAGTQVPGYRLAILLHGVAAVIELLSEPLYILASVNMQYKQRLILDSAPLAAKSFITLACLSGWLGRAARTSPPALIFSYAQLGFALITLAGYCVTVGLGVMRQQRSSAQPGLMKSATAKLAKPTQPATRGWSGSWQEDERQVLGSTVMFSVQAVVKLVLAEGSKMVLSQLSNAWDQGVVGLVSNLGSVVVRTLFQPLTEVAFTAFSRHGVHVDDKAGRLEQGRVLAVMVRGVCVLGMLAVAFGPPNAYLAIRLVYGSTWATSEAPAVLSVYCAYILLLAVNGVTEAFVHAVLDTSGLATSNLLLLGPTAVHLTACALLISRLGSAGFVAADALNMAVRICISLWYIQSHFKGIDGFSAWQLLPGRQTWAAMAVAHAVLHLTQGVLVQPFQSSGGLPAKGALLQVACSAVLLAAVCTVVLRTERQSVMAVLRRRQPAASADASSPNADTDADPGEAKKAQ